MAGIISWLAIFTVVLVAGATPSINNGSTAIIIVNNSITMTHRPNLTLPDVLNNTTAAAIIKNSTVTLPGALNSITAGVITPPSPAIILRGNNIDTASNTNETYVNTTIYMQKDGILKVIIPGLISFAGVALMVFLWWSSLKAKLVGVDDLPPIASLIADPTPSAIAPIVELVNRSLQNPPPPTPPPPPATTEGENPKK